ncbi:MAG: 50S ribosomal protein L25 [Candidatus Saccharibacteria bacterium]|nr:50S ribosomal protein L25 [Candidatus Saccharibacteria bacterium]
MSGTDISLKVEERTVVGKGVRQLRRDGMTPAVIHDHGKASHHIMAPSTAIDKVYQSAGKHHPVNLTLGTKKFMALIKDVAFEPRKHTITHIVFNAISAKEKQQTEVPIHLSEDIPAEKAGYLVIRQLDAVEIEALPKDLIDEIVLDASSLAEIGDKLTVADISVPTGVTIITAADHPIAVVEETKAQMSEEDEAAEAAAEAGDVPSENGGEAPAEGEMTEEAK